VEARYWVVDGGGSAGSLIADLEERLSVEVVQPKAREVAASCGQFYDAVAEQTLSHLDQAPLASVWRARRSVRSAMRGRGRGGSFRWISARWLR
jgi:hypothetical protein